MPYTPLEIALLNLKKFIKEENKFYYFYQKDKKIHIEADVGMALLVKILSTRYFILSSHKKLIVHLVENALKKEDEFRRNQVGIDTDLASQELGEYLRILLPLAALANNPLHINYDKYKEKYITQRNKVSQMDDQDVSDKQREERILKQYFEDYQENISIILNQFKIFEQNPELIRDFNSTQINEIIENFIKLSDEAAFIETIPGLHDNTSVIPDQQTVYYLIIKQLIEVYFEEITKISTYNKPELIEFIKKINLLNNHRDLIESSPELKIRFGNSVPNFENVIEEIETLIEQKREEIEYEFLRNEFEYWSTNLSLIEHLDIISSHEIFSKLRKLRDRTIKSETIDYKFLDETIAKIQKHIEIEEETISEILLRANEFNRDETLISQSKIPELQNLLGRLQDFLNKEKNFVEELESKEEPIDFQVLIEKIKKELIHKKNELKAIIKENINLIQNPTQITDFNIHELKLRIKQLEKLIRERDFISSSSTLQNLLGTELPDFERIIELLKSSIEERRSKLNVFIPQYQMLVKNPDLMLNQSSAYLGDILDNLNFLDKERIFVSQSDEFKSAIDPSQTPAVVAKRVENYLAKVTILKSIIFQYNEFKNDPDLLSQTDITLLERIFPQFLTLRAQIDFINGNTELREDLNESLEVLNENIELFRQNIDARRGLIYEYLSHNDTEIVATPEQREMFSPQKLDFDKETKISVLKYQNLVARLQACIDFLEDKRKMNKQPKKLGALNIAISQFCSIKALATKQNLDEYGRQEQKIRRKMIKAINTYILTNEYLAPKPKQSGHFAFFSKKFDFLKCMYQFWKMKYNLLGTPSTKTYFTEELRLLERGCNRKKTKVPETITIRLN